MPDHLAAYTDLLSARLHQSRDLRRSRDRGSARVVAVEALPVVQEILGLVEGPENETELGRGDVRARRSRVPGGIAVHARVVEILAHARDAAELVGPLQRVLVVQA